MEGGPIGPYLSEIAAMLHRNGYSRSTIRRHLRAALLSAKRDAATAQRLLTKALGGKNHPAPRVINSDKHAGYPLAIAQLKAEETLEENCLHRPVQYLNNVLEQDHRAIKRRIRASQHFRSFWCAWRTIAGYEAVHMIRKGQAYGSAAGAKVGLVHRLQHYRLRHSENCR
jgi:transposase-like protein